jgi:hypothetical protein
MQTHLIKRAAQIMVDRIKEAGVALSECRLVSYDDFIENGFITVYALKDGNTVACISQSTYSLECGEDTKQAQSNLIKKINQFWSEQ